MLIGKEKRLWNGCRSDIFCQFCVSRFESPCYVVQSLTRAKTMLAGSFFNFFPVMISFRVGCSRAYF
jgi:hypothetical protein